MRKKRSEVKDAAFAVSLSRYPLVTLGPRMQISPSVSGGSGLPCGSRIRTATPVAVPTLPGFLSTGGRRLEVIWPQASVSA